MTDTPLEIEAQPGPQDAFLRHDADVVVYGGAAGGGKSFALLLDALHYITLPKFRGVIFRRTYPEIKEGGGLWDTAMEVYPIAHGKPNHSNLTFTFPSGARIAFRHLQYEHTVARWQGAQIPWLGFDEATHFTEKQFLYLMSRNRSAAGAPPRIRLTCNPDASSWLKTYLLWWLDPLGYPDTEKAGAVRWFYRDNDETFWYGSRAEAEAVHPDLAAIARPKSFAFIPAKLDDNAALMAANPEYKANLLAQSFVERGRLLDGNWNVTASDGLFHAEWFPPAVEADKVPIFKQVVRAWDLAATEQKDKNDPDWLAGPKMGKTAEGQYWVTDVRRFRISPLKVKNTIRATAEEDGKDVEIVIEQEPGSAGAVLAAELKAEFTAAGFRCYIFRPDKTTGDKVTRAYPFSAECERKNVYLVKGAWNKAYLSELTQFPTKGVHDDQTDASCTAYRRLKGGFVWA